MIITNYQLGVAGGKIIEDTSAVANLNQPNIRHGMTGIPAFNPFIDEIFALPFDRYFLSSNGCEWELLPKLWKIIQIISEVIDKHVPS